MVNNQLQVTTNYSTGPAGPFLARELARCYAERGYEIACRLSVCLSVRSWRWGIFFTQSGLLWKEFHGQI